MDQVTNFINATKIYYTLDTPKKSWIGTIIYCFCPTSQVCAIFVLFSGTNIRVLQPLDISEFVKQSPTQELVLVNAQYMPFVLESLVNLQPQTEQTVCI